MTYIKKTDYPLLQKGVKIQGRLTLETKMLVIRKMESDKKRKIKLYVVM
jgi:hypothetical protein